LDNSGGLSRTDPVFADHDELFGNGSTTLTPRGPQLHDHNRSMGGTIEERASVRTQRKRGRSVCSSPSLTSRPVIRWPF
jgi:hypothetical protein